LIINRFNYILKNDIWKYLYTMKIINKLTFYYILSHTNIQHAKASNYWCIIWCPWINSMINYKFLITIKDCIKFSTPARFEVQSYSIDIKKFKTIYIKDWKSNYIMQIFRMDKAEKINPVTFVEEDFFEKTINRKFYEYKLILICNSIK